jgi:hypothetical protein
MQKIKLVLYYLEIFGAIFCVAKNRAFRGSASKRSIPAKLERLRRLSNPLSEITFVQTV